MDIYAKVKYNRPEQLAECWKMHFRIVGFRVR